MTDNIKDIATITIGKTYFINTEFLINPRFKPGDKVVVRRDGVERKHVVERIDWSNGPYPVRLNNCEKYTIDGRYLTTQAPTLFPDVGPSQELIDFYAELEAFDWFYEMSDSQTVRSAGRQRADELRDKANTCPEFYALWIEWKSYIRDRILGDPDATKPELPTE